MVSLITGYLKYNNRYYYLQVRNTQLATPQYRYTIDIRITIFIRMPITVTKWGNSAGIRIPSLILKTAGLSPGDFVDAEVTPERTIIIRAVTPPKSKNKVDIGEMLARITPENLPDVSKFETTPIGNEIW